MADWRYPIILVMLSGLLALLKIPVWWIPLIFAFVLMVLPIDNKKNNN